VQVPRFFTTRILRLTASKQAVNTAEVGDVVTEVSVMTRADSAINSEDIEQLHAAYSPADNVITEGLNRRWR